MISVVSIVEGDGEVAALPLLLRRIGAWKTPGAEARVLAPIRVYKDRFLKRDEEFRRHLLLAAAKAGDAGWILLVLDADDDCPAERSEEVRIRAKAIVPHRNVAVVMPNREYEAWFIAAATSLNGRRGFSSLPTDDPALAEVPRNAKGWMSERMVGVGYHETTDQPAFSALIDLESAHRHSRSFRKLCTEWCSHVQFSE